MNWLKHLFPGTCVLCQLPSDRHKDLCQTCENFLPWIGEENTNDIFTLFRYEEPIDHLITQLKFNHKLIYAKILGNLMAEKLSQHYQNNKLPELIIPMPLHKKRLKERGFNQAIEIAKPIAKKLGIPIDRKSCQRVKHTEAQSLIPAAKRHKNIANAFELNGNLTAKHIAILDDVTTTGSTIKELKTTLQDSGISNIDVWCCAKTMLRVKS